MRENWCRVWLISEKRAEYVVGVETMDLLKLLHTGEITLDQAQDIFDEHQRQFHSGGTSEQWTDAFELSLYEATAYLHGGTLVDLAKLRYEGWPTTCSRCHCPLDHKLGGWWFVRSEDGVPRLRHIECPSVPCDSASEADGARKLSSSRGE